MRKYINKYKFFKKKLKQIFYSFLDVTPINETKRNNEIKKLM